MARQKIGRPSQNPALPGARKIPVQRRSQERFERILQVAAGLIAEKGSDGLTMKDIVERADVSFGSMYQYFPDKSAVIITLAERFDDRARDCIETNLAGVRTAAELRGALCTLVDDLYALHLDEPVMRDIWFATQADKRLQGSVSGRAQTHMRILSRRMAVLRPRMNRAHRDLLASFLTHQIAAAVRFAVSRSRKEGAGALAMFKAGLPADLFSLAARLPQRR